MFKEMKVPEAYKAGELRKLDNQTRLEDGRWVPVRPYCFGGIALGYRLKMAFKVFSGQADVLEWER